MVNVLAVFSFIQLMTSQHLNVYYGNESMYIYKKAIEMKSRLGFISRQTAYQLIAVLFQSPPSRAPARLASQNPLEQGSFCFHVAQYR